MTDQEKEKILSDESILSLCEKSLFGQKLIEEAVWSLLYKKGPLGISDISKKLRIFRKKGPAGLNDAITAGVLNSLSEKNKVTKTGSGKKARWQIQTSKQLIFTKLLKHD